MKLYIDADVWLNFWQDEMIGLIPAAHYTELLLEKAASNVIALGVDYLFPLNFRYNSINSSRVICRSSLIILRKRPLGIFLFACTGMVVALPSSDHILT